MLRNTFLLLTIVALAGVVHAQKVTVPLGGNSFVSRESRAAKEKVEKDGWRGWTEYDAVFSVFVYLAKPGNVAISAVFDVPEGVSKIECSAVGVARTVTVRGTGRETKLGHWKVEKAGYFRVDFKGVARTGDVFANVANLVLAGTAVDAKAAYVKSNDDGYFYWGRRGPSVHLNYDTSAINDEIEYFYSEIEVPRGNDIVGSYFMADGFAEGYFGFQVNSPNERRVLFSVWSPFETDDPAKIPADKKIVMLKKGENVVTREFGNEGSGGQSFLRFNWKSGETYRFLLRGAPSKKNFTTYTAWFYAPEEGKWRLIASFNRPATTTYLKRLHSFLENFIPENGNLTRRGNYKNQWARTKSGEWRPLTKASFSYDETARRNYRRDYRGGSENGAFFLQNCGFFDISTEYGLVFTNTAAPAPPKIDLARLE